MVDEQNFRKEVKKILKCYKMLSNSNDRQTLQKIEVLKENIKKLVPKESNIIYYFINSNIKQWCADNNKSLSTAYRELNSALLHLQFVYHGNENIFDILED